MFYLTLATEAVAALMIAEGALVLWGGARFYEGAKALLYNRAAAIGLWVVAVAWTLWETTKLGPADFGSFKGALMAVFAVLGVASVWVLRDYLIVRAAGVIWLFVAWWILKAAYLQPEWTRIFLVAAVYAGIVKALYLAVAPWRARDLVEALRPGSKLTKIIGGVVFGYGILLMVVGATYRWVG